MGRLILVLFLYSSIFMKTLIIPVLTSHNQIIIVHYYFCAIKWRYPKIDGHRLILSKSGEETRLFTRHHNECTRQYPELYNVPIDGDVVLDGEVCCTDPETGKIDFELVMGRFQLKKNGKIHAFSNQRPVSYVVWDILFHKGRDLRELPLMKRRSILESVLLPNDYFSIVPQIGECGEDLYQSIVDRSMEGIVAKRKGSTYVSRRSHDWLKIINYQYADVYLAGYRKDEFGWLAHVKVNGEIGLQASLS
jgi:DNA ligase-1